MAVSGLGSAPHAGARITILGGTRSHMPSKIRMPGKLKIGGQLSQINNEK